MSLTGELSNKKSRVWMFFEKHFQMDDFILKTNKELAESYTLYPKIKKDYPWSDVGHIVEYLMCLHIGLKFEELFPMKFACERYPEFFMEKRVQYKKVGDYFKSKENFKILLDDLMRLSKIEGVFRSGVQVYKAQLPSFSANEVVLDDVMNIYFKSIKKNELINNQENFFCYNPCFDLSAMIGGADADLYLIRKSGNFLIDLKTTVRLEISNEMMFQLLGYVFLDSKNKHNLTSVGFYLTRQNLISEWSVDGLLKDYSNFDNLADAKKKFYDVLANRGATYGYLRR